MNSVRTARRITAGAMLIAVAFLAACGAWSFGAGEGQMARVAGPSAGSLVIHRAMAFDVSRPLALLRATSAIKTTTEIQPADCGTASCGTSPDYQDAAQKREPPPPPTITPAGAAVEQTSQGQGAAAPLVESFDGLGVGFEGPRATPAAREFNRNPSDNSLAAGPDNVVQIVNSRLAVFTKKGARYDKSGTVLYGPVPTNIIFSGFGGSCEARNNGDAVVRYDQLAGRWLIVMPIFVRAAERPDQPGEWKAGEPAHLSPPGRPDQPGAAATLVQPPPIPDAPPPPRGSA